MHRGWAPASGLLSTSLYFPITTGPIKVETTHRDTVEFYLDRIDPLRSVWPQPLNSP